MDERFARYHEVSRRRDRLIRDLGALLHPDRVLSSATEVHAYTYDASMEHGLPVAVCFPETEEEIAGLFALCRAEDLPLVPRGSGTNLSGGTTAPLGGVICQMSRLNRILRLEPEERRCVAQAYVYNDEINQAARRHGLHFAPDPSSYRVSTLGGNAAENSGGPHALKYGVTTQHILGLRAVLPTGEFLEVGGRPLERSGADLLALLVGSEGTLGVITELTLRLTPTPESVRTLLAVFDEEQRAGEAVSAVIASGIIPSTLEMIDRETIRAVEASMPAGYPPDADAVLLIELDGLREAVALEAAVVERVCRGCGAARVEVTSDPLERERLWHGRRSSYAALARAATGLMVCDGVVPRDVIPEALRRNRQIAERFGLRMADTFHAGDGNLHPKLIFEATDPGQVRSVRLASDEMMRGCIDLGGAITGEHGVGTEKIHAMPWLLDEPTLRLNRGVKLLFDGDETSNPGKVLRAGDVPAAAAPPGTAGSLRAALDRAAPGATAEPSEADRVDGLLPEWTVSPASAEELAAVLGACGAEGAPVLVVGGGAALGWGRPIESLQVVVRTDRMRAVREMRPLNLSATFEAGLTWAETKRMLGEHGLGLRFHPPQAERASLGGIVATAAGGPTRLGLGPVRDAVLGIGAALTTGELAQFGGRVMKNVAGYDLTHCLVGSRGALAALAHVTLRLTPLPEDAAVVRASCDSLDHALALGRDAFLRLPEPAAIRAIADASGFSLWVAFRGPRDSVARQVADCTVLLPSAEAHTEEEASGRLLAEVTATGEPLLVGAEPAAELAVPPARERAFALRCAELLAGASVVADVGAGYLLVEGGRLDPAALGAHAAAEGGWLLDLRGPAELRGGSLAQRPWTGDLARLFDPAGVLARQPW